MEAAVWRMSERLKNQVAWVSGAASGIGEGVARLFAAEGAAVLLADLQEERGRQIVQEIRATGGRATFAPCDVTSDADVRESIETAVREFGSLSIVVNSAGIVRIGLLHETDERDWDQVMDVNVRSIYLSTRNAIPHLRKQPRSYIVNVASISSFVGQAATPAYTTSKFAVVGLTKSIALDYAVDGVRCNCVCPGITDTPMLREHLNKTADPDATLRERLRRVPTGVPLSPAEIARTVLYLSCEDSVGVTGTSVVIDGGYLAAAEWQHPGRTKFME
jgi:NAD(P)-dependent dehydrogenase (short-subunit alcohol dehydrogenase family)